MVPFRGGRLVRATTASLMTTALALVIVSGDACTASSDMGPCACDAAAVTVGPYVYARCNVPVAGIHTTGPCSGQLAQTSGLVERNGVAYEEVVDMVPQGDGDCTVAITFANGFVYGTTFSIGGQWEACRSDPHGCGEYLGVSIDEILIGACGDAGLYGEPDASTEAATLDAGGPDTWPEASRLDASTDAGLESSTRD